MRYSLSKNKIFLAVSFIFFIGVLILLLLYSKDISHITINKHHTPFLDSFFKYITYLGSGWMILILIVIFLFLSYRLALMLAISNLFITIIVQFLKNIVFPGSFRPKAYFEDIYELYFISGVQVHSMHSFPSGHSATAFSIFFFLSLLSDRPVWKFLTIALAILTAFSRVYLSQHFMEDILLGSSIGLLLSFLVFYYFEEKLPGKYKGSLLKLKKQIHAY